jgi:hypothetical protein
MSKFEVVLVRVAYVAKLLIGVAGMVAVALLGMTGTPIPEAWQLPLQAVATVAAAVALFKLPNGPSLKNVQFQRAFDADIEEYRQQSGGDIE